MTEEKPFLAKNFLPGDIYLGDEMRKLHGILPSQNWMVLAVPRIVTCEEEEYSIYLDQIAVLVLDLKTHTKFELLFCQDETIWGRLTREGVNILDSTKTD